MADFQFQNLRGPMTINPQRHYDDHGQLIYYIHLIKFVMSMVRWCIRMATRPARIFKTTTIEAILSLFDDHVLYDQFYYNQLFNNNQFFDTIYDIFSTRMESLIIDHQFFDQFYYNWFYDNPFFDRTYYDMFLAAIESFFFDHQFSDQFYNDIFYENQNSNPTYDMFLTMIECFLEDRFPDQFLDMGSTTTVGDGLSEETIVKNLKTSHCPKKEGELCAVCLDDLSESDKKTIIGSLDCGHEYHEACIKQWLMLIRSNLEIDQE
ncbi:hypothetical protein CASFOL_031326 [Castilleja foliolosa]|uniref:RING-type E3 ubiquitin transferase n=1 Tax=Castilleja foliolosa TaxID=1961234 RepID=A0ABD3C4E6_9LAMI